MLFISKRTSRCDFIPASFEKKKNRQKIRKKKKENPHLKNLTYLLMLQKSPLLSPAPGYTSPIIRSVPHNSKTPIWTGHSSSKYSPSNSLLMEAKYRNSSINEVIGGLEEKNGELLRRNAEISNSLTEKTRELEKEKKQVILLFAKNQEVENVLLLYKQEKADLEFMLDEASRSLREKEGLLKRVSSQEEMIKGLKGQIENLRNELVLERRRKEDVGGRREDGGGRREEGGKGEGGGGRKEEGVGRKEDGGGRKEDGRRMIVNGGGRKEEGRREEGGGMMEEGGIRREEEGFLTKLLRGQIEQLKSQLEGQKRDFIKVFKELDEKGRNIEGLMEEVRRGKEDKEKIEEKYGLAVKKMKNLEIFFTKNFEEA